MPLPEDRIRALEARTEIPEGFVEGTRLTWLGTDEDDDEVVGWTSSPDPQVLIGDGDPNGDVFAPKGTLYIDRVAPALWQNTDGLSSWTQIPDLATAASGSSLGLFGDGSDGVCTFDGSATVLGLAPSSGVYTLTRDIYLATGSSLTGSAILKSNGFKIFCTGTLTVGAAAAIQRNGNAGSGVTAGVGFGNNTLMGSADGGPGGNPGTGVTGGTGSSISPSSNCLGGSGGAGGALSGGPGVGGGTVGGGGAAATATLGLPRNAVVAISMTASPTVSTVPVGFRGGAGGAGGSAATSSTAGGGGAGGGVLGLYARAIVNNGTISANGGAGGNASGAGTGAGGGAGGGGGCVVLLYNTFTGNAATATGGAGGTPQGAGKTGGAGVDGNVFSIANA